MNCSVCGQEVKVHSGDDGTSCYTPMEGEKYRAIMSKMIVEIKSFIGTIESPVTKIYDGKHGGHTRILELTSAKEILKEAEDILEKGDPQLPLSDKSAAELQRMVDAKVEEYKHVLIRGIDYMYDYRSGADITDERKLHDDLTIWVEDAKQVIWGMSVLR
jgi:hypothetical protein